MFSYLEGHKAGKELDQVQLISIRLLSHTGEQALAVPVWTGQLGMCYIIHVWLTGIKSTFSPLLQVHLVSPVVC